ncbi:hypothetical protein LLH00_02120 [bacterium]|nr:hypothetical protein [bacterium]
MHPFQRMAWFNLMVVVFTVMVFVTIYASSGNLGGSLAAFGILALAAFSGLFLAGGKGRAPLWDEYHKEINRRALNMAAQVFWFYFAAGAILIMHFYKQSVPADLFAAFFWYSLPLLLAVHSLAVLVFYGSDSSERRTLLDRWRGLGDFRRSAVRAFASLNVVGFVFLAVMLKAREESRPFGKMLAVNAVFLLTYFLLYRGLGQYARSETEIDLLAQARKRSLKTFLIVAASVVGGYLAVWALTAAPPLAWFCLYGVYYVILCASLSLCLGSIAKQPPMTVFGRWKKKTEPEGKAK